MRVIYFAIVIGVATGLPRGRDRQLDAAEVIRVVDEKEPIFLSGQDAPENTVVDSVAREGNDTLVAPTPVPDNVPITTEKFVQSTPDLIPAVVDISTGNPNNTPALPVGNSTTPVTPGEEDEDDSEEDSNEEEADEEDEEEEDDDEEEEDEEGDEEEEDDEDAGKKAKKAVVKREVAGEEVAHSFKGAGGSVVVEEEGEKQQSDEEDKDVEAKKKIVAGDKGIVSGVVGLQAVDGGGTGEDDEADSVLAGSATKGGGSVVLSGKV